MNESYREYFENDELRESIKTLRMNIEFAGIDKPITSVAITSSQKGEGKSTVALCLAIAMAEAGKSTVIVDNDLRAPQISNRLMIRNQHSLAELLSGSAQVEDFCVPTEVPRLTMLDMRSRGINNPVELLSSARYKSVIARLKELFDFVVIDAPPLSLFIDAAVVGTQVDGVLVVIGSGKTTAAEVKEVQVQLEKANVHILGAVLNGVKYSRSSYYSSYYYSKGSQRKHRDEPARRSQPAKKARP